MSGESAIHPSHRSNKVGLVAYDRRADGSLVFLLHLPKAKNPEEQADMQWGLIRGTVRTLDGEDLRSLEALRATSPEQIESPEASILHEAYEEAGILPSDIAPNSLIDHGFLAYGSKVKHPYEIHFFSARINAAQLARYRAAATDATDLCFKSLDEIEEMARLEQFKRGYSAILQSITPRLPAQTR